jgi:ATP-dependent helicase/nuclease subunit A
MSLLSQYHFKGRQEQAATDPNPRIAVTAGAGSGKTLTLVARYLHLLEQGYPLRSILAITFTEKAAREMRSRIRDSLSRATTEGTQEDNSSFNYSPSSFDSARIGTIHSLCAEILRAHPAEAGLDPAFDVLEEGLAAALQADAIDSALAWAATDESSTALFGSFRESELHQTMEALLARRLEAAQFLSANPRSKVFETGLQDYLKEHLDSPVWLGAISELSSRSASVADDKLELARKCVLDRWDEIQSSRAAQNWDELLTGLAALRKAISVQGQKANWNDIESVRAAMNDLRGFYDEHLKFLAEKSRFRLDEQITAHLPAIQRVFNQVLNGYQTRKDTRQSLDFDDLEGLTAQLLARHPEVRTRLQSELRAVLVDEFQDTNIRQRQIVYALTGFSSRLQNGTKTGAENTDQNDPRIHPHLSAPGTSSTVELFVVGDSKQSIYRFRQADVTVFRQVQADIRASGGLSLDLDLTFRAHKGLLETLNCLLAPILGENDDPARPYVVPFAPLRAYYQSPREQIRSPFVEFHIGLGESAVDGRMAAAQALAFRLRQLRESEGFAWGEMALLFRSSIAFPTYENALEEADIPFVTVAGRGFYDRPEIRDLLNALAAIAEPDDDLALMGLLRSPAFALSDAQIYQLRFPNELASPAKLIDALRGGSIHPSSSALRPLSILDELHSLAGRAPAAAVLKRFLDLTNYRVILAGVPNGGRMIRNVDKLLADAHRSRLVNLNEFLAYIQTLYDVGLRESEAPADPASTGAVQLMTVHKAKGLEFPLAVLADTAYEHRGAGGKVELTPDGILLDLKDGDFHPTAWQISNRLTGELEDAEDRRLLYVAATRAKEKLLISGHVKIKRDGFPGLAGWLERLGVVTGFDQVKISNDMSQPGIIPLNMPGCSLKLYPLAPAKEDADSPLLVPTSPPDPPRASDLLDHLPAGSQVTDEPTRLREADPPSRVWRVVADTKRPRTPAWVVGRLVHESLRRWRFPDADFENFVRPFALEAGLTDPAEIHATMQESRRLLERLLAHPLYAELDSAERHHEVPYFLPDERGIIDLLYRTEAGWFIIDFKTDELRSEEEARVTTRRAGYDHQVARYACAVANQLGVKAKTRLVFLNVENHLAIFDLEENP